MPGFWELVLIFLIVLLIFGANRLPEIAKGIGKAISEFKRHLSGNQEIDISDEKKTRKKRKKT